MTLKQFEDTLNSFEHGYERYMNLVNFLNLILDEACGALSEEDYTDFKEILKDRILEDLWLGI